MFNVKVDKYNVQFTFSHIRGIGEAVNISDVTRCVLRVNGQEFNGIAACSTADVFNKEKGRKLALKRALEQAREKVELPQMVRFQVWERYHQRHIENRHWYGFGGDSEPIATGTLDPEYRPKAGSDDLVNMA